MGGEARQNPARSCPTLGTVELICYLTQADVSHNTARRSTIVLVLLPGRREHIKKLDFLLGNVRAPDICKRHANANNF